MAPRSGLNTGAANRCEEEPSGHMPTVSQQRSKNVTTLSSFTEHYLNASPGCELLMIPALGIDHPSWRVKSYEDLIDLTRTALGQGSDRERGCRPFSVDDRRSF
jgi:hypothetical protein